MTSRKRTVNDTTQLNGEVTCAGLPSHISTKRCRLDLQEQLHASVHGRDTLPRPVGATCAVPVRQGPNNTAVKQARPNVTAGVQHGNNKGTEKSASEQRMAVLMSFRPFLQQLAAGIVAGYTTVKARQNTLKPDTGDSGSSGASIQGSLTTAIPTDRQAINKAQHSIAPHITPQPVVPKHNSSVGRIVGKASSSSFNAAHRLHQLGTPEGVDAVALVVKKSAKKPSAVPGPTTADVRHSTASFKSQLVTSVAAGQPGQILGVHVHQQGMSVPAAVHAAPSRSALMNTVKAQQQMQLSEQHKPVLRNTHQVKHKCPVALDLRDRSQPESTGPSAAAKAATALGATAAAAPSVRLHSSASHKMPPPSTAPLPPAGRNVACNVRVQASMHQHPVAAAEMTYYETIPNAADSRKINSIRQHVMFLESTLGNMSPQVGSAYLFLADVLQCEGSQWSLHHAARARTRAMEIFESAKVQQQQQQIKVCGTPLNVDGMHNTGTR